MSSPPSGGADKAGGGGLSLGRVIIQRMGEATAQVQSAKAEATWNVQTRPDDDPTTEWEYFFVAKIPSEGLGKKSQNKLALELEPSSDEDGDGEDGEGSAQSGSS